MLLVDAHCFQMSTSTILRNYDQLSIRQKILKLKVLSFIDKIGVPDDFNELFADIATDSTYLKSDIKNDIVLDSDNVGIMPIYDFQVQQMLKAVKKTSSDAEVLHYWLFRNCSFQLAQIIAHIFNQSILSGGPPRSWNHS